MNVISTERIPIKSWCAAPEAGCIDQAKNLANLPFAFKHVALMPDTHQGYGMPIGGVLAAKGVVVPNAVGVDIGCGMIAAKTPILVEEMTTEWLKKAMGLIRELVPVGFNHQKHPFPSEVLPREDYWWAGAGYICQREYDKALKQLGTLGGGNHFIEIQRGDDGHVWVMIHSGSRNLGKQVADHYNKLAKQLNAKWHCAVNPKADLAFFPMETEEARDYIREMKFCLAFAKKSRSIMMHCALGALDLDIYKRGLTEVVDVHHNYAVMENHFGENVMVHRKGATSARAGETGIIPGSQGTASYIVKGLGNPESFMSCSHGAGRRMGRKEAERKLDLAEEIRRMDEKGILHGIRGKGDLDEAAGAYKDIDTVMAEQADLVKILTRLEPMAVVKG